MIIDLFFTDGLFVKKMLVDNSFDLKQIIDDSYINQQIDNKLILTFDDIEFCFLEKKIFYWQIDVNNLELTINNGIFLNKIDFSSFMSFLKDNEIKWEFNKSLCFLDQLSVLILKTQINFVFSFDEKIKGEIVTIGRYF